MFKKYTEKARLVMFYSRHEASIAGSNLVEPEHILLGLIHGDKEIFRSFSDQDGIEKLERNIRENIPVRQFNRTSSKTKMSDRSNKILRSAEEIVEKTGQEVVNTEHIFAAILEDTNPSLVSTLNKCEITAEAAQKRLERFKSDKIAEGIVRSGKLDELQRHAESLFLFLKNRKIGEVEWEESLKEQIKNVHLLTSEALN